MLESGIANHQIGYNRQTVFQRCRRGRGCEENGGEESGEKSDKTGVSEEKVRK